MRNKNAITKTIATVLAALSTAACGPGPANSTRDGGPHESARTFRLDTTTTCRTDAFRSTERGPAIVTIVDGTITLGADDEVLAGIPLPFSMRDGFITVPSTTVATGETYGPIEVSGVDGELASNRLRLGYEFRALDVTCTVSGAGTEL